MYRHIPNLLTVSRGAGAAGLVVLYETIYGVSDGTLIVFLCFLALAATDFVDGELARYWQCKTEFGAIADPVADKMLYWAGLFVVWRETPYVPVRDGLALVFTIFAVYDAFTLLLRIMQWRGAIPAMHTNGFAKWRTACIFMAVIIVLGGGFIADPIPAMWLCWLSLTAAVFLSFQSAGDYLQSLRKAVAPRLRR